MTPTDRYGLREGQRSEDPRKDDFAYIYSTWLKGLRAGSPLFAAVPKHVYFKNYHAILEAILAHPEVKVVVACRKDEPGFIAGYSVSQFFKDGHIALHWIHVREEYRGQGFGKWLVPRGTKQCSHLTRAGWKRMPKDWIFNPFEIGANQ